MSKRSALATSLVVSLGIFGCGGNSRPTNADDGHGHGASYACGTEKDPVTFVLKDVVPAAGTAVANQGILEQFTVVDSPFLFSTLTFDLLPAHTAGTSSPNPLGFTLRQAEGNDVVCSTTVDSWAMAPSHVEVGVLGILESDNGCAFVFPSPLFSYDVTSP
jgi:hypothetical protein